MYIFTMLFIVCQLVEKLTTLKLKWDQIIFCTVVVVVVVCMFIERTTFILNNITLKLIESHHKSQMNNNKRTNNGRKIINCESFSHKYIITSFLQVYKVTVGIIVNFLLSITLSSQSIIFQTKKKRIYKYHNTLCHIHTNEKKNSYFHQNLILFTIAKKYL